MRPENFLFIGTNNWIESAVQWSIKYFFALNLPIFRIRLAQKQEEGKEEEQANAKHYAFQAKAIIYCCVLSD